MRAENSFLLFVKLSAYNKFWTWMSRKSPNIMLAFTCLPSVSLNFLVYEQGEKRKGGEIAFEFTSVYVEKSQTKAVY